MQCRHLGNLSHAPPGTATVYSQDPTTSDYKDIAILVDSKSVGTSRQVQLMCENGSDIVGDNNV